jgi:hypothetical protein
MNFALGKNAPARLLSTVALSDHLDTATAVQAVPAQGWEYAPAPIPLDVLGNDTVGDCVIAAAMHYAQNETANTGNPLTPTTDLAIQTYSAITGYIPGDPTTDNGTDFESQLFPYWKSHGLPMRDTKGNVVMHKILGFAALDRTSTLQLRWANFAFGGILWGFNCPESAMDNTDNWVYVPNSPIEGGHGVNQMGQGAAGGHLDSWGLLIPFQWEFMRKLADECYCVVTPQWLDAQNVSPSGLNLNQLLAAMKSV